MKKSFFTLLLCFGLMMSYGQALKVDAGGDVGIQTADPRFPLDINLNTPNNPTAQIGSFGVQSFSGTNGFLNGNGFWNGTHMESFVAGKIQLLQFTNGKVLFRTSQSVGAGGTTNVLFNNLVCANDETTGLVGINEVNPTQALHVAGNALKTVGGNTWLVPSDARLKSNVQEYTAGLEQVLQIRPVSFEYNGKGGTVLGERSVGIIAQEIEEVMPSMVSSYSYSRSEIDGINVNSRGKEEYLKYNGNELPYMLVNAIKEQNSLIEEKDERISELENQMEDLTLKMDAILDRLGVDDNGNIDESTIIGLIKSEVELKGSDFAKLDQNRPNPFNGVTRINYEIPTLSNSAVINFHNIDGQIMKRVQIDHKGAGEITLRSSDIPAGTYSYTLIVDGEQVATKQMILMN